MVRISYRVRDAALVWGGNGSSNAAAGPATKMASKVVMASKTVNSKNLCITDLRMLICGKIWTTLPTVFTIRHSAALCGTLLHYS